MSPNKQLQYYYFLNPQAERIPQIYNLKAHLLSRFTNLLLSPNNQSYKISFTIIQDTICQRKAKHVFHNCSAKVNLNQLIVWCLHIVTFKETTNLVEYKFKKLQQMKDEFIT